jgi:heat-inducible transcriptional repressor
LLIGAPLTQVEAKLNGFISQFASERVDSVRPVLDALVSEVDANRQEKIIMAGAANLVRSEQDFAGSIGPLLEAIEEQVVLLRLMSEMDAGNHGVGIRIGSENSAEPLSNAAIVVSGYETAGQEIAKLGVVGPTRMDYASNIAAVSAVARYLSKTLES